MSSEPTNPNQCRHFSPRGQRCRMLRASDDDSLCPYHRRLTEASPSDPEAVAAELLDSTGNLNTADGVNALLANTVKQLARQRIDRRDALAIGYLAQLLLNTVPGVQKEYQAIRATQARQALRKSIAESRARLRARPPAAQPATEQETAAPQTLSAPPPEPPPQVPEEELLVAAGADVPAGDAHT